MDPSKRQDSLNNLLQAFGIAPEIVQEGAPGPLRHHSLSSSRPQNGSRRLGNFSRTLQLADALF
jgi:hypothetical protein